jgi:class 3 adenylate cyclase/tetratricopeptide (TPR) repeat protein
MICVCGHDAGSAKFCPECGQVLARSCPQCRAPVSLDAKFCPECGAPGPARPATVSFDPDAQHLTHDTYAGERRQLTVLFCDLVGSTALSTQLDPEEWRERMAQYHGATADIVTRFGGSVVKYLGDGVLALFGYPHAHDDDAERAVRAGLEMVQVVQSLVVGSLGNGSSGPCPATDDRAPNGFSVRVGIHTGLTVIDDAGGTSDVFGETPNIAARVQSVSDPDTVVITAATQRLVAGLFVVEERGPQRLKGVPQPVVLYRVVQPSGVRSRLDVSAGRHTPFVGRHSELGVLADAWDRTVEGMGQTVLVQGEAGIGKSRLCYQLREQLSEQPHTWLECRCSPYTTGTPFRPIIELIEQALTFGPGDTPADKLDKLKMGLDGGGFAGDDTVALLAEWLGLPESAGYAPLLLNPDLNRRKTMETLVAWNLKSAELQPIVVLMEDLHWCDPSSLELLGRLVAQSATARVLLIGTARPEFTSPWPARSNLQTLTLSRLTKRQAREMVTRRVEGAALSAPGGGGRGGAGVPPSMSEAVIDVLVARADGIPLFVEELTQAVVEAGGDAAVAEIPVTLQDSLLARLDRISSAKEVAQRAAVLGREFSYALLAATAGLDEGALQQGLARLVEAELLFVRGEPPDATYTFKHALVQEAAYESLLKRTRQQLHARVVEVLDREFPDRATAEPAVVAAHCEAAGLRERAVLAYRQAGVAARARSAHREAATYLRKAITLLEALPEHRRAEIGEIELQLALGSALMAIRGYGHDESRVVFAHACVLCERGGSLRERADALGGLAINLFNSGALDQGLTAATEVLAIGEELRDERLQLMAHEEIATIQYYQGKFAQSFNHAEAGVAIYDPERPQAFACFGGDNFGISIRAIAGMNLWYLGYPDQGLRRAQDAVALARRYDDRFSLGTALWIQTSIHALRREYTSQRACAEEMVALSEENGFPLWVAVGKMLRGWALAATGSAESGLADFAQGLEHAMAIGNRLGASVMFGIQAEIYMALTRYEEAIAAVDMGFAIVTGTGETPNDSDLCRIRGENLLLWSRMEPDGRSRSAPAQAQEAFRRAVDIARTQESKSLELRAATSLARLWRDQGKRSEARHLLAPIYSWFTEGFDTRDLQDAKALLCELT